MRVNNSMNLYNRLSLRAAVAGMSAGAPAKTSFRGGFRFNKNDNFSKSKRSEYGKPPIDGSSKLMKPFDKNGKLNERVKKYLDETPFLIQLESREPKRMTIKQALIASVREEYDLDKEFIHATYTRETAQSIIANGFDPKRISRAKFGPGIYFALSEGSAMNYGSAKLIARCKGHCARFDGTFYDNIKNNEVVKGLTKFMGGEPFPYSRLEECYSVLNEYVRNVLVDELGYDFGYGTDGQTVCMVAFNTDAISNIRHY